MRVNAIRIESNSEFSTTGLGTGFSTEYVTWSILTDVTEKTPNGFTAHGVIELTGDLKDEALDLFSKIKKHYESGAK